ncbi:hypothetical protein AB0D85_34920, partial [Streptomyces sp. NPDC048277]
MSTNSPSPDQASDPLAAYGWDAAWAAEFAPYAAEGLVPGRVARVDRGRCEIVIAPAPAPRRAPTDAPTPLRADTGASADGAAA